METMSAPQVDLAPAAKGCVLIVDQDRFASMISKMLVRSYHTEVVHRGVEAFERIQDRLPDIIVADMDIPVGGLELAELVSMSPEYNSVPIILMSSKSTPDTVIRARRAGASSYLAKPFRPRDLHNRIECLLPAPASGEMGEAQGEPEDDREDRGGAEPTPEEAARADIRSRMAGIEGLPSFPATHAEITKLARSGAASSDEIADKIQLDPSLLATVFRLANSAHFGFRKTIDSLPLAVTLLGLEEIANLVMSVQVFEKLGDYEGGAGLDLEGFWKHSVGTAFVARATAKRLEVAAESAFLAGMLHDLGKIVLDRFFQEYYTSVMCRVRHQSVPIAVVEHDVLGLSHADVGGHLAIEWKFSEKFQDCMLYHHDPRQKCRYHRLVCVVHLADAICRKLQYGSGGDDAAPRIDRTALERFALGKQNLEALIDTARAELGNADSFLSALASPPPRPSGKG
jgi:putative nucleotidyltransferase with HDIG domain